MSTESPTTEISYPTAVPAVRPGKAASKLTGLQKTAVLMVTLGEQSSSEILRELDEDEVQRISREIAGMPSITSDMSEDVMAEFYQMLVAQQYVLKGGMDYARKLLIGAFGSDQARRLLDRVTKALGNDSANFDALQKADPLQLANFIHNEHPQTIALILSHLGATQAAALLNSLPAEIRSDVAVRMANLDQISPEIIAKIASIIGKKMTALGETNRETYGGVRAVAEMFNRLDQAESTDILDKIQIADPTLGENIRHYMFTFQDLINVDQNGIRELLARADRKILTIALKGTDAALRDHFLGVMSARGAEMMREDMEALGPVRMKDVESAQQEIIVATRLLESEGVINLKDTGSDQYVS